MKIAQHAFGQLNWLSWQLRVLRQQRTANDIADLELLEATVAGRLRELDPEWLPSIAISDEFGCQPCRVMNPLKCSMPYSQSRYTFRSRDTIDAQRATGLDPLVLTVRCFTEHPVPAAQQAAGATRRCLPADPTRQDELALQGREQVVFEGQRKATGKCEPDLYELPVDDKGSWR